MPVRNLRDMKDLTSLSLITMNNSDLDTKVRRLIGSAERRLASGWLASKNRCL